MIQTYDCIVNGNTQTVEVDVEATIDNIKIYPWLYTIFINMHPSLTQAELVIKDVEQCKQRLITELVDQAIYVGCKIVSGWYEMYFYLQTVKGFENKIKNIFYDFDYTFESNAVKDKSWKFYETDLLPNEFQANHIQNRQIIDELIQAGDDMMAIREVEHYILFQTSSLRQKFYDSLDKYALTCKELFDSKDDETVYSISLQKMQNINFQEICKFTDSLVELSYQFHAQYAGWSTKLAKEM